MTFRPMLACEANPARLPFPLAVSPKLDGIRAVVRNGQLLSRTLKPIPNRHIFYALSSSEFDGLDGELIVGPPNAKDVYRTTVSGVMSEDGEPNWAYYVFDLHNYDRPWILRYASLRTYEKKHPLIKCLQHEFADGLDEVLAYEERVLRQGYEGVMLRDPQAPYKHGRSTQREGYLLKLKRFNDSEARVLEVIEEMHNANEATTNELGLTKRSSHKANKVGKGRMGALRVQDIHTGVEFELGTGFTDADKEWWWTQSPKFYPLVKYKYLPVGVKDRPRHPVYLGIRLAGDL